MTIAQAVRGLRKKLQKNQIEFAEMLGCQQNTVSRYEVGKLTPGPLVLIKLAQIASQHGAGEEKVPVDNLLRQQFETGIFSGGASAEEAIARLSPHVDRMLLTNAIMDLLPPDKRKDFGFRQFVPAVANIFYDCGVVAVSVSEILALWPAHWNNPIAEAAFRDALGFLRGRLWGAGNAGEALRVTSTKKR